MTLLYCHNNQMCNKLTFTTKPPPIPYTHQWHTTQPLPDTSIHKHTHSLSRTQQLQHTLHDGVLRLIVRLVLTGYLQHCRYDLVVRVEHIAYVLCNGLCDENDADVLSCGEVLELVDDVLVLGALGVDDEEVGAVLVVAVADAGEEEAGDGILVAYDGYQTVLDGTGLGHWRDGRWVEGGGGLGEERLADG